jgi:hypothetical protein
MTHASVMAGLVPAIHVFVFCDKEDVDARHKTGHDDVERSVSSTFGISAELEN